MKRIFAYVVALVASVSAFAEGAEGKLRVFGEVSNYVSFQSRNGLTDETGMFFLLPSDQSLNTVGMDLNRFSTTRWLNLDSKLGVKWSGFRVGSFDFGAMMEGNFLCAGDNSCFRLRHAYVRGGYMFRKAGDITALLGQTWHPMAEDKPFCQSLSCGAPFNPYSFAPQLRLDYHPFNYLGVCLAALWQSDYKSTGPAGPSRQYLEWAGMPELFASVSYSFPSGHVKAGLDLLTIKPRLAGEYPLTDVVILVNDKLSTVSAFLYGEYTVAGVKLKGKTVLAESGEHLLLMGGYGLNNLSDIGTATYIPYRNSSSWISAEYEWRSLKGGLMLGYLKNLGSRDVIYSSYFNNGAKNLLHAVRVAPSVEYSYRNFKAAFEYEWTGAQYGSELSYDNGLATKDFRFFSANRITLMVSCSF